MQGWRKSNEDAHITAIDFEPGLSLFAVFDGHGGAEVAKFCEKHFIPELKKDDDFKAKNYEKALSNVFVRLDFMLHEEPYRKELVKISKACNNGIAQGDNIAYLAGCTANVVMISQTHIYCSNAGDSRCVVSQAGNAIDMSEDHKPDLPKE